MTTTGPLHRRPIRLVGSVALGIALTAAGGCSTGAWPVAAAPAPATPAAAGASTGPTLESSPETAPETPPEVGGTSARPAPAEEAPPRCRTSDLAVSTGDARATAPSARAITVVLINDSGQRCAISGYGGAALLRDRTLLPTTLDRDPGAGRPAVVLAPGESAHKNLSWSVVPLGPTDDPRQACPTADGLLVTPPDETTSLGVRTKITACDGRLSGTAYQPGRS